MQINFRELVKQYVLCEKIFQFATRNSLAVRLSIQVVQRDGH